MNFLLKICLPLLLLGAAYAQQEPSFVLANQPFIGVVFQPAEGTPELLEYLGLGVGQDVDDVWTASEEDALSLETALKGRLEAMTDNYYGKEAFEHYNDFQRQYMGVVIEGKRYVFATYDRCTDLSLEELTANFIAFLPLDGGSCFMEVLFDPEANELTRLNIHGG